MSLFTSSILYYMATSGAAGTDLFIAIKDFIGLIAPLAVIIVALIYLIGTFRTARLNRDTGKETTDINEKDVTTKATAQLTEMFTEGLAELRTELKEASAKIKKLEDAVEVMQNDNKALVHHIEALELLVPNPPGAPIRPIMNKYKYM